MYRVSFKDFVIECDDPSSVVELLQKFDRSTSVSQEKKRGPYKKSNQPISALPWEFEGKDAALRFLTIIQLRKDNERVPAPLRRWFNAYAPYWILDKLHRARGEKLPVSDLSSQLGRTSGKGISPTLSTVHKFAVSQKLAWTDCVKVSKTGKHTYWSAGSSTEKLMTLYAEHIKQTKAGGSK